MVLSCRLHGLVRWAYRYRPSYTRSPVPLKLSFPAQCTVCQKPPSEPEDGASTSGIAVIVTVGATVSTTHEAVAGVLECPAGSATVIVRVCLPWPRTGLVKSATGHE